jgi:hypothetical protein
MNEGEVAPMGGYEPDESYMKSLFARPVHQTKPKDETFVAGHSFNGISREEAERLRWENLGRRPVRVKEEEEKR